MTEYNKLLQMAAVVVSDVYVQCARNSVFLKTLYMKPCLEVDTKHIIPDS